MAKQNYNLVGIDGNAHSVMGYVAEGMRNEGYSKQEIDDYYTQAKAGDYRHTLRVSSEMTDNLNRNKTLCK